MKGLRKLVVEPQSTKTAMGTSLIEPSRRITSPIVELLMEWSGCDVSEFGKAGIIKCGGAVMKFQSFIKWDRSRKLQYGHEWLLADMGGKVSLITIKAKALRSAISLFYRGPTSEGARVLCFWQVGGRCYWHVVVLG